MQKIIRQMLCKAFDEGSESPCDLKDDIINTLMEKVDSGSLIEIDEFKKNVTNYIENSVSQTIVQFFTASSGSKIWCAGGRILRTILGANWPTSDCDIYCNPKGLAYLANKFKFKKLMTSYQHNNKLLQFYSTKVRNIGVVHLMLCKYENAEKLIEDFDLSICQICVGYDNGKFILHGTNEFWRDLWQNQINLSEKCKQNFGQGVYQPEKIMPRIKKYISRGFRDRTGIIEQGFYYKKLKTEKTTFRTYHSHNTLEEVKNEN